MTPSRRSFLVGLFVAPAIVRASSLMSIVRIPAELIQISTQIASGRPEIALSPRLEAVRRYALRVFDVAESDVPIFGSMAEVERWVQANLEKQIPRPIEEYPAFGRMSDEEQRAVLNIDGNARFRPRDGKIFVAV